MQAEYDKAWGFLTEANKLQRDTYLFNPEVCLLPVLLHHSFKLGIVTRPHLWCCACGVSLLVVEDKDGIS